MTNYNTITNKTITLLNSESYRDLIPLNHNEGFHEMRAEIPLPDEFRNASIDEIKKFLHPFLSCEILPGNVFINGYYISIGWTGNRYQMVTDYNTYRNLIIEFAIFLDKFHMEDLEMDLGFIGDSPNEISDEELHLKNYDVHFNEKCFSYTYELFIHDWREM